MRQLVEEIPASGKKRSLGAIAVVATLGSLLFGYDTGVGAGASATVPESSRWYAANLRIVEAIGSLKRVRVEGKDDIAGELNEMLEVQRAESKQEKWSLSQILTVTWARKLLSIGINTAMYYTPKFLNAAKRGNCTIRGATRRRHADSGLLMVQTPHCAWG